MLSINYAKKNGDGFILNLYADNAADITNFDATVPFGIYGVPMTGSVVTLVGGTEAVNYYLNDSKELVKIDIGGDTPTPGGSLTPFEVGDNVTAVKFADESIETINAMLDSLDISPDSSFDELYCDVGGDTSPMMEVHREKTDGVYLVSFADYPLYVSAPYHAEGDDYEAGYQPSIDASESGFAWDKDTKTLTLYLPEGMTMLFESGELNGELYGK